MKLEFTIKNPDNMLESNLNTLFYYVYHIEQFIEISDEYHKSKNDIKNYNLLITKAINLLKDMKIKIIK